MRYAKIGDTVSVTGWKGTFTVQRRDEASLEAIGATYSYFLRHDQTGAPWHATDLSVTLVQRSIPPVFKGITRRR